MQIWQAILVPKKRSQVTKNNNEVCSPPSTHMSSANLGCVLTRYGEMKYQRVTVVMKEASKHLERKTTLWLESSIVCVCRGGDVGTDR